jgi:hypothetical protein
VKVGVGATGLQSAVNHDGGCIVPAEEVDGDPRGAASAPGTGRIAWTGRNGARTGESPLGAR